MNRVHVIDGELCFSLPLAFEMAVLTRGPEEARATMRDTALQLQDEGARQAMLKIADTPVLVPLTQEDKYTRVNDFCNELGSAVGKVAEGHIHCDPLCTAFGYGFAFVGGVETPQYHGVPKYCFKCGNLAGELVASLFPEDDDSDFQPPDFEEIMMSFLAGLVAGQEAKNSI